MLNLYFYDLETSGVKPRTDRVMQFAGQRLDLKLKPIGEPDNFFIKLSDDVLPEPDAILVTGITPQKVNSEGITEAEFLSYFNNNIATPNTVFVGFNNIRFDDEFIRFMHYRNFYDAYEWAWKNNRSRWDILDLVRMTRALRPENIEWPFDSSGKPTVRLQYLTAVNKLDHKGAHDALSDVNATIAMARLIYNKQPKLFNFLFKMRDKKAISKLVNSRQPFIYSSGKYPSEYLKTTVAITLGDHPGKQGALVYNLRTNPEKYLELSPVELAAKWQERVENEVERFPIKTLQFNRCPAVAPMGVLDNKSIKRLNLDLQQIKNNQKIIEQNPEFYKKLIAAINIMDKQRQVSLVTNELTVDEQLYESFFDNQDHTAMAVVRAADDAEISSLDLEFKDQRLTKLLPLYKARNFPGSLTSLERELWEKFRYQKIMGGGEQSAASRFFRRLSELAQLPKQSKQTLFLLEELQLYGESILPTESEES